MRAASDLVGATAGRLHLRKFVRNFFRMRFAMASRFWSGFDVAAHLVDSAGSMLGIAGHPPIELAESRSACENRAMTWRITLAPTRSNLDQSAEDASEKICATLMEAVSERALRPGTKLMEDVIARHFGVSRTAVRGAIAILERAHLVELRRNHGSFIASPDQSEAKQLLQTRRVLEMATIATVMASATPEQLDRLERLTVEEEAIHSGVDDGAKERLSGNFHLELARAAGNAVMEEMLRNVLARLSLVAALYERDDGRKCGAVDHRSILAAIRSGDSTAAGAAMSHHLDDLDAKLDLDASPDNEDALSTVLRKFAPTPEPNKSERATRVSR